MHTYSINSKERVTVIAVLGFISIAIILTLKNNVHIPEWLEWVPVPSVFAVFGVLFWLFDQFIWKRKFFRKQLFSLTPDLNGKWQMISTSSMTNHSVKYEATLTIKQTWTKIYIYFGGEKAIGKSTMANIEVHTIDSFTLKWEYLSEYKPEFTQEESMHYGMTKVLFEKGDREYTGSYYADQSRHSYGSVVLIKKA